MVYVRNNLWQALYHLCKADEARILWIDALCINQDDMSERNHQVTQMGRVYESSVCVVAWLGVHDDSSRIAMEFIQTFDTEASPIVYHWRLDDSSIDSIAVLCEREYWTRLWIIQELVMAPKVTLQCGDFCVSWVQLSGLLEGFVPVALFMMGPSQSAVENYKEALKLRRNNLSRPANCMARTLSREREIVHHLAQRRPLIDLCIGYGLAHCEDSRDGIFGLLAFTYECCQESVAVDYSSSLSDVSRRLLYHKHTNNVSFQEGHKLRILRVMLGVSREDLNDTGFLEAC